MSAGRGVVHAIAPGRVNLIGDHTDYTGGLVMPMAIDRATEVRGAAGGPVVDLVSDDEPQDARVPLRIDDPAAIEPPWARYVAGVVAEVKPAGGLVGRVTTTVPIAAGLSSSAALELSIALAIGFRGTATELAQLCQRAEHRASGVPCGIMDQLCIATAQEGHATLIDCHSLVVTQVAWPDDLEVVVVYGHQRTLVGSDYATRVAECRAAEQTIGPLRLANLTMLAQLDKAVIRARAHHVITENQRVRDFASALAADDRATAGRLMMESHRSLATDFETSTPQMNTLVDTLVDTPGVWGARMTGGGFGGCAVAIGQPGALRDHLGPRAWVVKPSTGARLL